MHTHLLRALAPLWRPRIKHKAPVQSRLFLPRRGFEPRIWRSHPWPPRAGIAWMIRQLTKYTPEFERPPMIHRIAIYDRVTDEHLCDFPAPPELVELFRDRFPDDPDLVISYPLAAFLEPRPRDDQP